MTADQILKEYKRWLEELISYNDELIKHYADKPEYSTEGFSKMRNCAYICLFNLNYFENKGDSDAS
jgi:hypothetical protein